MLKRRKTLSLNMMLHFKPIGIEVLSHYTDEHQSSGHLYHKNPRSNTGTERESSLRWQKQVLLVMFTINHFQ